MRRLLLDGAAVAAVISILIIIAAVAVSNYVRVKRSKTKVKLKVIGKPIGGFICFLVIFALISNRMFIMLKEIEEFFSLFSELTGYAILFVLLFSVAVRVLQGVYLTEKGILGGGYTLKPGSFTYMVYWSEYKEIYILEVFQRKSRIHFKVTDYGEAVKILINNYKRHGEAEPGRKYTWKRGLKYAAVFPIVFAALTAWYFITMPFVAVGDVKLATNSENALFSYYGVPNSFFNSHFHYDLPTDEVIDIINLKSRDLKMLKYMPNLKRLNLVLHSIDNYSALGSLTSLEELYIGHWRGIKAKDYSFLENLTNLRTFVCIGANGFDNFAVFEKMPELTRLALQNIYISASDLEILCASGKYELLDLSNCTLEDWSALGNLSELKILDLSSTNIDDLSFLKSLQKLEKLLISKIPAEDYSMLLELPELKLVYVSEHRISGELVAELENNGVYVSLLKESNI